MRRYPFSMRIVPEAAQAIANAKTWRDEERMDIEAMTIAIWNRTSA